MRTDTRTISEIFSNFSVNLNFKDIPEDVLKVAKLYVLDWFGCCVGAVNEDSSKVILSTATELNNKQECTVLGFGNKLEPTLAALVNGTMSHALEMDDDHRTMCGHPGVVVIPAALAACEKYNRDGQSFLEAVIVGYEMVIRLGTCFLGKAYYEGWHPTSTCGVFGATAAAAKAFRLNIEKTATSFGIACSMSGGTRGWEQSYIKRFHAGNAARNGVLAAIMAKNNFTSSHKIFEAPYGFFNTHCFKEPKITEEGEVIKNNIYDANILCKDLGKDYYLMTNSFKVHSGGRFGASSIDACLEIVRNNEINPSDIKEITIGACDFTIGAHFKEGCYRPKNSVAAHFSLPYAMALAVLYKEVSVQYFKNEYYNNFEIIEIMDKVTKYVDQEAEEAYPDHYLSKVTITINDGTTYRARVDYPKGDPENRPTDEEIYNKFRNLAGIGLSKNKIDELLVKLQHIDKVKQIKEITELAVQ